ncbi:beta-L-arabinofuranosidase domain-containing protein [Kribbella sp. NPDC049227]|uniref:beta-L-arabinofuranosidase domain-containing protein n=1 Tax=Kribbella sp. NPDC049227 TaxID=3364113 RepID=UPI0037138C0F
MPGLTGPALRPLPLATLRPQGWLLERLRLQADGMAGHLDEFWPDVARSGWIGGDAEGWERGPYWLDGIVGVAYLLDDDRLKAKVRRWVDYILEHQHEDGWFGPRSGEATYADHDSWPRIIVLKALLQHLDATGDPRVVPAALRFLRLLDGMLDEWPLREWARSRWTDVVWVINQLHDLTGEDWLLGLAAKCKEQGFDWFGYADRLPFTGKVPEATLRAFQAQHDGNWMNDGHLSSHGVNVAMGLKAMPVWQRHDTSVDQQARLLHLIAQLDACHGQANGLFSCDEHLAGRHPSQGTETCTVVEYLASLEVALESFGPVEPLADRLERLAFNALPASTTPDEWTHQYVQQANQVICHVTDDRIYTNNGPDANVFGLEPHFGCCTANRHQGWPRFTSHLWMRSPDGAFTALSYAPCSFESDGLTVSVVGAYPFSDDIEITTRGTGRLHLRIPTWATNPTLTIATPTNPNPAPHHATDPTPTQDTAGPTRDSAQHATGTTPGSAHEAAALVPGSVHEVEVSGDQTLRLHLGANVQAVPRSGGAITLERGPLVFSLPIGEDWRQIGGEEPHATWEIHPTTAWNYAIDPEHTHLFRKPISSNPFSPTTAPLHLQVQAHQIPWPLEHGAAAAPPPTHTRHQTAQAETTPDPVTPGSAGLRSSVGLEVEELTFIPYGCTTLRVTELPAV